MSNLYTPYCNEFAHYDAGKLVIMAESWKSYDVSFKLKVIAYAEEKGTRAAVRTFKVHRKRKRDWCHLKDKGSTWLD